MGRPSIYDSEIKPYIKEIKEAVSKGATIEDISDAFEISISTLYKYKSQKKELKEAFTRGRKRICIEIKGAVLKSALGHHEEEQKTVARKDKNGENIVSVEKYDRYYPPNPAAAAMLLRNWDKDWRDNDQTSTDLKKQEADLKKAIAEANNFDLNFKEVKE